MKRIFAFILLCIIFPFFFAASAFAQTVTGAYDSFDGTGFTEPSTIFHTWIFDQATGANICGNSAAVYTGFVSWTSLSLNDFGADTTCSSVLPTGSYSAWTYDQYSGYDGESYCGGSNDYATCSSYLAAYPSGYTATFDFTVSSGPPPTPSPSGSSTSSPSTAEVELYFYSIWTFLLVTAFILSYVLK